MLEQYNLTEEQEALVVNALEYLDSNKGIKIMWTCTDNDVTLMKDMCNIDIFADCAEAIGAVRLILILNDMVW